MQRIWTCVYVGAVTDTGNGLSRPDLIALFRNKEDMMAAIKTRWPETEGKLDISLLDAETLGCLEAFDVSVDDGSLEEGDPDHWLLAYHCRLISVQ